LILENWLCRICNTIGPIAKYNS